MAGIQVPQHVAQERQQLMFIRQKIQELRISIFRDVYGRIAADRFGDADLSVIYDENGTLRPEVEKDMLAFFANCSFAAEGVFSMAAANSALETLGLGKTDREITAILDGKAEGQPEGESDGEPQPAEPSNIILP